MKYAISFREQGGPIQSSLSLCAEARGVDVFHINEEYNWDDYDALIWMNNRPPTVETSAKIFWWMNDLRPPRNTTTTASVIGLCNKYFLLEYEDSFGVPTVYLPQCGNDTETVGDRDLHCDVVFLGDTGFPAPYEGLVQTPELTRLQIGNREWGWNRMPVINALKDAGLFVAILSGERVTPDSKWLYQTTPISLSISLPAAGYTSNRMYNILSSRGFCLVAWFPGLEDLFENHKHLVWFRTLDEAAELAKHYLARPGERDKIREAGYVEYLANHTASSRVDTMLEAINAKPTA
jgi:hypothetical protein